jgi:hypothetical protein
MSIHHFFENIQEEALKFKTCPASSLLPRRVILSDSHFAMALHFLFSLLFFVVVIVGLFYSVFI